MMTKRAIVSIPLDVYLFEIDSMRLDRTMDIMIIANESTEAFDEEEFVRSALQHAKSQGTYGLGWYGLSWHRYVVDNLRQPASHPDAQGYVVWFEVTEDGNWHVRNDSPLLQNVVI